MDHSPLDLVYTRHGETALRERFIPKEWVERTIRAPALTIPDPEDPEVERIYLAIPENGNRVLRVAANTDAVPWRVVSAFLDRDMKAKL